MRDHSTQTDRFIKFSEKAVDAIPRFSKSLQTSATTTADGVDHIRFDTRVIDTLIECIEECRAETRFFDDYDRHRRNEKLSLTRFRSVPIPIDEPRLPVAGLAIGSNFRVAVLIGESRHESWCQHATLGRVLIYQKLRFSVTIHLSACPTKALFAPHNQLIVATTSGELLLIFDDEVVWRAKELHLQCVTCLHLIAPQRILTAGLDGTLTLLELKPTGLDVLITATISLFDLPHALRRSTVGALSVAAGQHMGIVDVTESEAEIYIAGETGAIWLLDVNDLTVRTCGYEPSGIEQFTLIAGAERDWFLIRTPMGQLKFRPKTGGSSQILSLTRNSINPPSLVSVNQSAKLVIAQFVDEIVGVDVESEMMVLSEKIVVDGHSDIGVAFRALQFASPGSGSDDLLVGVTADYKLNFYSVID